MTAKTKLIWVETPTNPLLSIADIAGIAQLASKSGVKVLVDNTFASPALQLPLALGADIVLHSTVSDARSRGALRTLAAAYRGTAR